MMKKRWFTLLLISICATAPAQENEVQTWYLEEIKNQAGTWIADNTVYQNDNEPMDQYAIEWTLSPLKNSLYGRLYGMIDHREVGTYWDFHKYWDPAQKKVILMQIGWDGTLGTGEIKYITATKTEMMQLFTSPDGTQRKVGHRSEFTDEETETGSSYTIDAQNAWSIDRTYTWKKAGNENAPKESMKNE